MAKKTARSSKKSVAQKVSVASKKNTGMAALAYVLFFILLFTDARNDAFVKFHVKQAMALLAGVIIWAVVSQILIFIPVLGWIVGWLGGIVISIAIVVLWVLGIMNALNGRTTELPVIGKYAKHFTF